MKIVEHVFRQKYLRVFPCHPFSLLLFISFTIFLESLRILIANNKENGGKYMEMKDSQCPFYFPSFEVFMCVRCTCVCIRRFVWVQSLIGKITIIWWFLCRILCVLVARIINLPILWNTLRSIFKLAKNQEWRMENGEAVKSFVIGIIDHFPLPACCRKSKQLSFGQRKTLSMIR